MSFDCPRPARPLSPKAVAAADGALYSAHQGDARPNALYDAAGNKKQLSPTDPKQELLRDEWVDLYGKNGGKLERPKPKSGKAPGSPIQPCPYKAALEVLVSYEPLTAPVENATVTVKGPITKVLVTDAAGSAKFTDLPPGTYDIAVEYKISNALVDLAQGNVGSTTWAVAATRAPFPADTNKCNLFVYEMVTGAGFIVPQKPHTKLYGLGATVMLPPNAGDWASSSPLGTSTIEALPEPGDVIAWSHAYADATGHVAIVSYPAPSAPLTKALAASANETVTVTMSRQVIGANQFTVDEDTQHFWHYYREGNAAEISKIVFRRLH